MTTLSNLKRASTWLVVVAATTALLGCSPDSSAPVAMRIRRLEEASFVGGHALKEDNQTFRSTGTGPVRVPQIKVGEDSTPVCYTWETSPEIHAKFSVVGSQRVTVLFKLELEPCGGPTLHYQAVKELSSPFTEVTFSVSDPDTQKLRKQID